MDSEHEELMKIIGEERDKLTDPVRTMAVNTDQRLRAIEPFARDFGVMTAQWPLLLVKNNLTIDPKFVEQFKNPVLCIVVTNGFARYMDVPGDLGGLV